MSTMADESLRVDGAVVVGVDGSESSRGAARWAARWASARGERVLVVRVIPHNPIPTWTGGFRAMVDGPDFAERVTAHVRDHLEQDAAELRAVHPELTIETAVVAGHPVELLARYAGQAAATVLAATGSSGLPGVLGGTVGGVLHEAHGPVTVIPAEAVASDGPVVVGLDGGPQSPRIAQVAIDAAARLGCPLVAVHAWEIDPAIPAEPLAMLMKDQADIEAEYLQLLTRLTAGAQAVGVPVEHVVRWGRPHRVLAELAADAALLVLGSRGMGGFAGLLFGSVSRAVTRHPVCPTLVVRD